MCALSLQLMALFTGFLAPYPPSPQTCTSETAAQKTTKLPSLSLPGPLNCVLSALGLRRYEL